MSRLVPILFTLWACSEDAAAPPKLEVKFPEKDLTGDVIPFRAGGSFAVQVIAEKAELGRLSHATVEIVTGTVPPDAVVTSTIPLTDQEDGTLAGTATLKWPLGFMAGEDLKVRALVGDTTKLESVPFEPLAVTHVEEALSSNGVQLVRGVCFQSTSTDGTLQLHLAGATLPNGMADGTAPLAPGSCATNTVDPKNPTSIARVAATVIGPDVQILATLQNTRAFDIYKMLAPPAGMLLLKLSAPSMTPPRLSIVDLEVVSTVNNMLTSDVVVTFQTVPSITITPVSVVTGSGMNQQGNAIARFQMPKEGSLAVTAISGSATDTITFYP